MWWPGGWPGKAAGTPRPGQTVVELTSGNTGAGLAIICAIKGHPFVAVMSRGNSPERAAMMRGLGAEVLLVEQAAGSSPGRVSGADLALVVAETERIVAFCDFVGSGGTFAGFSAGRTSQRRCVCSAASVPARRSPS